MNVKVEESMSRSVITTEPHKSIDHVRGLMEKNKVSAIPVINTDGEALGIVSSTDLVPELNGSSPVSKLMTDKVYTVPKYDDASTRDSCPGQQRWENLAYLRIQVETRRPHTSTTTSGTPSAAS